MADLMISVEGGDAEKAAAELGAALEYELDPIGRVGSAPAPLVVARTKKGEQASQDAGESITMTLGIPNNLLAEDEFDQKMHLLERLRRFIDIAARHRESGTTVHLHADDELRDLADMQPEDIVNIAKRSSP